MSIVTQWRLYFENPDEGFGSTYDRVILHRHFARLEKSFRIASVLESPSFGMTGVSGINSFWWAARKKSVTVTDDDLTRLRLISRAWNQVPLPAQLVCINHRGILPFGDQSFDLSWNFAAMRFVPDPETVLSELARVTRKVIFLCQHNRWGLGGVVRRLRGGEAARRLNHPLPEKIISRLMAEGWQLAEENYLDVPPWPDIEMSREEFFRRLGLRRLGILPKKQKRTVPWIMDYFTGKEPDLEEKVLRFSFLERAPRPFKILWAHHRYFIFTPKRPA